MDYLLDLLQGMGIAAAIGIRPFLPTLLAGALAAGDVGLDFDGTDFSFLEKPVFLFCVLAASYYALDLVLACRSVPLLVAREFLEAMLICIPPTVLAVNQHTTHSKILNMVLVLLAIYGV